MPVEIPKPTVSYDEADMDLRSAQDARGLALRKIVDKTGLAPNDWPTEVWDELFFAFYLAYQCRVGNARFYGGIPVLRPQMGEQNFPGF